MYLEIALRMITRRADFRRLCSDDDVSAVAALPYLHFALFKYGRRLHVLKQSAVSFFVVFLNFTH